jgi:hypothetical protein
LHEWRIDRALREEAVAPSQPAVRAVDDVEPAGGQIRLMHPIADSSESPLYVVVLDQNASGDWRVAPFSRFSEPAVPGEWLTGLDSAALRVLCLWNDRTVSTERLARSWVVGQMGEDVRMKALSICARLESGEAFPESIRHETGPPLRHPLDPRHEYLDDETEHLDRYFGTDPASAGSAGASTIIYPVRSDSRPFLKAAEDHEPYGEDDKE